MSSGSPVVMDCRTFLLYFFRLFILLAAIYSPVSGQFAPSIGEISVLAIRVSFLPDEDITTTGDGSFLTSLDVNRCENYVIDPPPHDKKYFDAQLKALDNYFRSVSKEKFWLNWTILPGENESNYSLNHKMKYYHPYGDESLQDQRMAEFFRSALETAYSSDSIHFNDYDVVVIFHAGIGQDFNLPFLDPTPEDIPSTYIDSDFLFEQLGVTEIQFDDGNKIRSGIILPETQNHLLYDIADDMFVNASQPCDYQFGLTGTFALMMGFAIGLPPLWVTDTGESGVGVFALMDQGSNNGRGVIPAPPDAWTRIDVGWESPTIVRPTTHVSLIMRDSVENQIVKVDINDSEFFLIENRNNWISGQADIDSIRWKNRDENDVFPPYIQVLRDFVNVTLDEETGVITSIPNYDIGLPGSGLLIWHVDENKIRDGKENYNVNVEKNHRGIDLEEGDGSQDIGYVSQFPFFDPSLGLWSDLWFADNSEYFFANPGFKGQLPSFGPDTYPNTRSYNGADSFIEINNISNAGKTMTFSVENTLLADGFPDTSLHIHFFYDVTNDGVPEIIGGRDSLWWSTTDSIHLNYFFCCTSSDFQLLATGSGTDRHIIYVGIEQNSTDVKGYKYMSENNQLLEDWSQQIPYPISGFARGDEKGGVIISWDSSGIYVNRDTIMIPFSPISDGNISSISVKITDSGTGEDRDFVISLPGYLPNGGLIIESNGISTSGLHDHHFSEISVSDMDLDGEIEVLAREKGSIFIINTNFTFESGFPINYQITSPILARNLYGDEHPELVVQADSGDILILDWQGIEQFRLSNSRGSELRMLSQYKGRNCITTESSIWLFDSTITTNGNEWPYLHHDPTNRRIFEATLEYKIPDESKLINDKRTYNYPNPADEGSTTIRVFVESAEKVEISIYDLAGYFVKQFVMNRPVKGEINEVVWDVTDVESGVYFAHVMAIKGGKSEDKVLKIAVVH